MPGSKPSGISDEMLRMLEIIRREGGTDCTGTCHHRAPGEFHCHVLARELRVSSQGVKNRILELMRLGLLARHRVEREERTPVFRFMITAKGKQLLDLKAETMSEAGESP